MKKILNILSVVFILGFLFVSCDKIEEPYAEPIGGGGGEDTTDNPEPKRVVLLEDYTGHTCVNCPGAAETAHGLQQAYDDQLVVMAVHAGWFARPTGDFPTDFRTEVGTELDEYFGISLVGNPNGMVNRQEVAGSPILSPNAWGSRVASLVEIPPVAYIEMEAQYDPDHHAVDATVTTSFFTNLETNLNLCVYVLEDSIQAPQKNNDEEIGPTPVIEDYYHNHVLRASLNGTWGDLLNDSGVVQEEDEFVKTYHEFPLDPAWVASHCSLVAFVYDDETKEILQAAKVYLVE